MDARNVDPLDALRSAVAASSSADDPLSGIVLLDEAQAAVSELSQAAYLQLGSSTLPKKAVTRIATNKAILAAPSAHTGKTPTPSSDPSSFLTLDALVFALQSRSEPTTTYVRLSTAAGLGRLALLERSAIIDYLLGKSDRWEGVVDASEVHGSAAAPAAAATAATPAPGGVSTIAAEAQSAGTAAARKAVEPGAASAAAAGPSTTPPGSPSAELKRKYTSNSTSAAVAATSGTKRSYVVNKADAEFVKRLRRETEVILRTRADAMRGVVSAKPAGGSGAGAKTAAIPTLLTPSSSAAANGSSGPHLADFSSFRDKIQDRLTVMKKLTGGSSARSSSRMTAAGAGGATGGNGAAGTIAPSTASGTPLMLRRRPQEPIILISNSPTSLINMFNVKAFLEEGIFVNPERAKAEARGIAEPIVTISYTIQSSANASAGGGGGGGGKKRADAPDGSGRKVRFLVVDHADSLAKLGGSSAAQAAAGFNSVNANPHAAWDRVVAVFTTGQEWQFKNYKHSDPNQLFKHVLGIYPRFSTDAANPVVTKSWGCKEVVIGGKASQRHTDKQVVAGFWRHLQTWVQQRKPHLLEARY